MIDLHTQTLLSDGELLPSELARRAEKKGCRVLAFTDHVDFSNVEIVVSSLVKVCRSLNMAGGIRTIPGVEITHVPPPQIPELAVLARQLGARIVVAHGETLVEPVAEGTNRSALESDIDILAHPGLLSEKDAAIAAERGVRIEISCRTGHSLSNGHIAGLWYRFGFPAVLNTDAHDPEDLVTDEFARNVLLGCGVKAADVERIFGASEELAARILGKGTEK